VTNAPEDESILDQVLRLVPPWATWGLGIALAVVAIGKQLSPALVPVAKAVKGWHDRRRQDQRHAERRSWFADYVEGQIRRLGEKEEWRDNRYAELEAEIEVRAERGRRWFLRSRVEVRRLPSLSKALEEVPHRLVLLEGDPGSGKSIALRHLTQLMCLRLIRRPAENEPIPLYLNLKDFRPTGPEVSAEDLREFVLATINQGRDRDIDRYLESEFAKGVQDGTWLFLFDSFDEIPAILSATEANETIERYSDAVYNFLHGMGRKCRGIVASREFRGPPRRYNWPKFTIVPLTWTRKLELVRKADLDAEVEQSLIDDLRAAPSELRGLSDNPMFLGLLCEHVRDGNTFPETAHVVTENYVSERFSRDAGRIRDIFAVEPELVREIAEELAFQIASEQALGLTVERRVMVPILVKHLNHSAEEIHAGLDALEYTKLARSSGERASITFAHRRIQEYFATHVVLRDVTRVDTRALVMNGRWRESAVTVLQVQDESQVRDTLDVIAANLVVPAHAEPFVWQPHQFYLLEILADGGGYAKYPAGFEHLSRKVDAILVAAWESGIRRNRKWTLEVCPAASPELALRFISEAFEGDSEWLREEAYTQARRVRQVTVEIEHEIRQMLLDLSISGEVWRSHRSIRAQLCRILNPDDLLRAVSLLRLVTVVDWVTLLVVIAAVGYYQADLVTGLIYAVLMTCVWIWPRVLFVRPAGNRSRWYRTVLRLMRSEYSSLPRPQINRSLMSAPSAFLLVFVRALWTMLVVVAAVLRPYSEKRYEPLYFGVFVLVSGAWLIGALLAVRGGRWLRPAGWPFLFILPVVQLVLTVRDMTLADVRRWLRNFVVLVFMFSCGLGFVLALVVMAEYFPEEVVGVLLVGLFVVLPLLGLITQHATSYLDKRRAEVVGVGSGVDASWLARKLTSLRSSEGIVHLLRNLQRASPKPIWNGDALELLGSISRQAELYRSTDKATRKRAGHDFAEIWRLHGVRMGPRLRAFAASEVLDEIGKVEDDSHVTR
jgi:hypothetical protein